MHPCFSVSVLVSFQRPYVGGTLNRLPNPAYTTTADLNIISQWSDRAVGATEISTGEGDWNEGTSVRTLEDQTLLLTEGTSMSDTKAWHFSSKHYLTTLQYFFHAMATLSDF